MRSSIRKNDSEKSDSSGSKPEILEYSDAYIMCNKICHLQFLKKKKLNKQEKS